MDSKSESAARRRSLVVLRSAVSEDGKPDWNFFRIDYRKNEYGIEQQLFFQGFCG